MKRRFLVLVLSVSSGLAMAAVLALVGALFWPGAVSAAPLGSNERPPAHIAVYLNNHVSQYDDATIAFLNQAFAAADAEEHDVISYTIVSTLTPEALAGSVALVVDESSDGALSSHDSDLIHSFVNGGGKLGLFVLPRYYWDTPARPNPASYQGVADLFGNASIGEPVAGEVFNGFSSAGMGRLFARTPFNLEGQIVTTFDYSPFSPIVSTDTEAALVSDVTGLPVAVANRNGLLVTTSIGDEVQGDDSNDAYHQFVINALVWLANGAPLHQNVLPMILNNG